MKTKEQLGAVIQDAREKIIRNARVTSPDELYQIMLLSANVALIGIGSTQGHEVAVNSAQAMLKAMISRDPASFPAVQYIRNSAVIPTPKTLQ